MIGLFRHHRRPLSPVGEPLRSTSSTFSWRQCVLAKMRRFFADRSNKSELTTELFQALERQDLLVTKRLLLKGANPLWRSPKVLLFGGFSYPISLPSSLALCTYSPQLEEHFKLCLALDEPFNNALPFVTRSASEANVKEGLFLLSIHHGSWAQALMVIEYENPVNYPLKHHCELVQVLFKSFFYCSQTEKDHLDFTRLCERLYALGIDFSKALLHLDQCARFYQPESIVWITELFLRLGADPHVINESSPYPLTPLWTILRLFHPHPDSFFYMQKLVQIILAAGARADTYQACGRGALHFLALNERLTPHEAWPLVALLMDKGASILRPDDQGLSAFEVLSSRPHLKAIAARARALEEERELLSVLSQPLSTQSSALCL